MLSSILKKLYCRSKGKWSTRIVMYFKKDHRYICVILETCSDAWTVFLQYALLLFLSFWVSRCMICMCWSVCGIYMCIIVLLHCYIFRDLLLSFLRSWSTANHRTSSRVHNNARNLRGKVMAICCNIGYWTAHWHEGKLEYVLSCLSIA